MRALVRYSPKKLWYLSELVQGLAVEEAKKQLDFVPMRGAAIYKEVWRLLSCSLSLFHFSLCRSWKKPRILP